MLLAIDHWHIEPSSICTLKCPRCPRAELPESLLNKQLKLDFFKNQIGETIARKIKKITFCGNDGDPIYCRDLIEICIWFKTLNPSIQIVIVTNGSYKPADWWQYLGRVLDIHDELHFSLDGWDQESNQKYRINCNWESIVQGIKAFRSVNHTTFLVRDTIAFKFNEHELFPAMFRQSVDLGFDLFQLTKSTKFNSHYPDAYPNDELEPSIEYVAQGHRFERVLTPITNRPRPGKELKTIFSTRAKNLTKHNTHSGICLIGNKGVFLNSQGEFYPCCWTANRYSHNSEWHDLAKTQFNLYKQTIEDILADTFWSTKFLEFSSFECKSKCTKEKLLDENHTLEW